MMQFIEALRDLFADPGRDPSDTTAQQPGQGLVEYALILAFIAIFVIVTLIFFGDKLTALYSKIGKSIPT